MSLVLLALAPIASASQLMLTGGEDLTLDYLPGQAHLVAGLAGHVWQVDRASGSAVAVTDDAYRLSKPRLSPDGRYIVAVGGERPNQQNLWLVDRETRSVRQLTNGDWRDDDPAWHPTEPSIVFASDRSGSWQLWKQRIDDSVVQRLTTEPGSARDPAFASDGRGLLYVASLPDRFELRQRYGAGRPTTLLVSAAPIRFPSARPDGVLITYWAVESDGKARLEMLLPTELTIAKQVPDTPRYRAQRLSWEDRDHFLVAADSGGIVAHTFASVESRPIPMTAWLSVAATAPLSGPARASQAGSRYVLRVGHVLDVVRQQLRADQDLLIDAGRIAAIEPRQGWPGETVIDLGDAIVMPALIDIDQSQAVDDAHRAAGVFALRETPQRTPIDNEQTYAARIRAIREASPNSLVVSDQPLPDLLHGIHLLHAPPVALSALEPLVLASGSYLQIDTAGVLSPGHSLWQALSSARMFNGTRAQRAAADTVSLPPRLHARIIAGSRGAEIAPPLGLHANLLALSALGVSNAEILGSATWRPAGLLGLTDGGLIEEGYAADLIVLNGNPLEDLTVLLNPIAIVDAGTLRSVDGLIAP